MGYSSYIGQRYIKSEKKETISTVTIIAIVGVAMGVGLLSSVFCIASGFQDEFTEKVLGVNAHVLIMKYGYSFHDYRDVMETVNKVPGVKASEPFVIQEMMISKDDKTAGILLKGVDPQKVGNVLDLPQHIVSGSIQGMRIPGSKPPKSLIAAPFTPRKNKSPADKFAVNPTGSPIKAAPTNSNAAQGKTKPESPPKQKDSVLPGVVIGKSLAENLEAKVGDIVHVTTPLIGLQSLGWSSDSQAPKYIKFKVTGVFHAGFHEYDTKLVFTDYYQAARFFDNGDSVTGIELVVHDAAKAKDAVAKIQKLLPETQFNIVDWEALNKPLFNALQTQKLTFAVMFSVIVLLAALNIVATLIMMVFDKKKEIAILKSMGATHMGIMKIFLHAGAVVGLIGISIGLTIGFSFSMLLDKVGWELDPSVYLIDHLPVTIDGFNFAISGVVAFLICLLATTIPSFVASLLRPVDGIRQD